jgi:hypothetical protein
MCLVGVALVALLFATDRRLGLHQFASTRYRFHAIPVAVSALYHQRPHDYTAYRYLAMRFQNPGEDLDEQIKKAVWPDRDFGGGTYFWVADDRGLADFVMGAFWLFGPKTLSLSKFYFVLLATALLLFAIGYWRRPAALLLPLTALLAWLAIAQVMLVRVPMQFGRGWWGEEIALYESRMFDVLALVSVLHLAVLAGGGARLGRAAWFAAVPQAALLVFLYHARSSIGWQYLALFSLIAVRVSWWGLRRIRAADERPPAAELARPLFVAMLLVATIGGLKQYQREVYHPDYLQDYGQRTFWHNALMGLAYHPGLRDDLPMALCDDRNAVELVLHRMEMKDPELDRNEWNWKAALNSLGNHNRFNWDAYEVEARTIYFELWRDDPERMVECYGYYKPLDTGRQAGVLARRLRANMNAGRAMEFVLGSVLMLPVLVGLVARARRDEEMRLQLRSMTRVAAFLVPFSLIPGIAFYPALTTIACFYLLCWVLTGVIAVLVAAHALRVRHPQG